jgi:hypothetical protein
VLRGAAAVNFGADDLFWRVELLVMVYCLESPLSLAKTMVASLSEVDMVVMAGLWKVEYDVLDV